MTIPTVGVPYRLANSTEPVTFHGLTFLASGFSVDALEDVTSMTLARLRVTFENVSREFQALLETYWSWDKPWTARLWYPVDLSQPDEMPFGSAEVFLVAQVQTNMLSASAELIAEGITLSGTVPKRRYTATSGFPGVPRRIG